MYACVRPIERATGGAREWIRKLLCFLRNLVVPEFRDAHCVGRRAVICQDATGALSPVMTDSWTTCDAFDHLAVTGTRPQSSAGYRLHALCFGPGPENCLADGFLDTGPWGLSDRR